MIIGGETYATVIVGSARITLERFSLSELCYNTIDRAARQSYANSYQLSFCSVVYHLVYQGGESLRDT